MEKSRGGRPRKDESKRGTHVVSLRISESEYARLKEAAKKLKVPVTRVIRDRLWMFLDE